MGTQGKKTRAAAASAAAPALIPAGKSALKKLDIWYWQSPLWVHMAAMAWPVGHLTSGGHCDR